MKTKDKNTAHTNNNTKKSARITTKKVARKTARKITNWSAYNNALKSRGNLSIFLAEDVFKQDALKQKNNGKNGHPFCYSDEFIKLILIIRELFHLPLRQTSGFAELLFNAMKISRKLPDYSTLSRRAAKLTVDFLPKCRSRENIVMLIDSSGFKLFGEGEWKARKHGYSRRRTWRELHIAIDHSSRDIVGLINTSAHTHDNAQLLPMLDQVQSRYSPTAVQTIIGDGAYDAQRNYLDITRKRGIEFIAPPPKNATLHLNTRRHFSWYDTPGWEERNQVVRHVIEYGLDGWKADVDYHRRSLVENTFFRLKTIFGERLKSRTEANQLTEQKLKALIINQFNSLGLPRYSGTS